MSDKKVVLLIEDDLTLAELTGEMIKMFGFDVYHAVDMENSLKLYNQHKDNIGLAIFDMNLEDTTGPEVLQEFQNIGGNFVPVLASGMMIDSEKDEYLQLGFKEVIGKPYSMTTLKEILDRYLA